MLVGATSTSCSGDWIEVPHSLPYLLFLPVSTLPFPPHAIVFLLSVACKSHNFWASLCWFSFFFLFTSVLLYEQFSWRIIIQIAVKKKSTRWKLKQHIGNHNANDKLEHKTLTLVAIKKEKLQKVILCRNIRDKKIVFPEYLVFLRPLYHTIYLHLWHFHSILEMCSSFFFRFGFPLM